MTTRAYSEAPTSLAEMIAPRKRLVLAVPLEPYAHAEVDFPASMTEANWQQFMAVLEAMKPGIVRDEP